MCDLSPFRKYEQVLITDAIDGQLSHAPDVETRNRKQTEPNPLAGWELRIGAYRVFHDVDPGESTVTIRAIGWKEHNKLYIRGQEYAL